MYQCTLSKYVKGFSEYKGLNIVYYVCINVLYQISLRVSSIQMVKTMYIMYVSMYLI